MGGNFGINVFVLISGYFLIKDTDKLFDLKKLLKFWGQVFFYSIGIYIIFSLNGVNHFELKTFIKSLFPITFESWWFASTYFVLYILHPFINMFLNKLNKSEYQKLIVALLIIWCIIPTLFNMKFESNNLLWFITLYCISGYISLFGLNKAFTRRGYFVSWIIFSLLRYLTSVIIMLVGTNYSSIVDYLFFYGPQSILTFLSAASLFMYFKETDIGYKKWINILASATFGVYLIHDNSIIRPYLWETVFNNAQYQNSLILIPYSIGITILVYICCTIIDLIRKNTLEKPYMKLVNKYSDSIQKPFERIINSIKKKAFGD